MIVIVDYGIGNLGSIRNMLKSVGVPAAISSNVEEIENADKLILPGVGAYDTGMRHLLDSGLIDVLNRKVLEGKTPTLGICLGMQLLMKGSEEGDLPGLGWIDGHTVRYRFDEDQKQLKVPHMGWNTVNVKQQSGLFSGLEDEAHFYFVHSFHVVCSNADDVLTETSYGYDFVSSVRRDNVMGTQFHPEKSHKFGKQLLKNFAEIV